MPSQITNYINEAKLLSLTQDVFGQENKNIENDLVEITCKLYENDKDDPKKKNESCRLLAGNLLYEFRLKDELVYKVYIDFTNPKGKDVPKRLKCIKNHLLTLY
jgi:hypothetical protein